MRRSIKPGSKNVLSLMKTFKLLKASSNLGRLDMTIGFRTTRTSMPKSIEISKQNKLKLKRIETFQRLPTLKTSYKLNA